MTEVPVSTGASKETPSKRRKEALMAKTYHLTPGMKLVNTVSRALLRLGLPLGSTYLLTVKGWKSGRWFTTPVTLIEDHERRWLVSPYGEVNWVRNARATGQVTLTRGRHCETPSSGRRSLRDFTWGRLQFYQHGLENLRVGH